MELIKEGQKQFAVYSRPIEEVIQSRSDEYQILYIWGGHGVFKLDFQEFPVKAHQLFFVSEKQLFSVEKNNGIEAQIIQFTNDFFCIKLNRNEVFCDAVIYNTSYQMPAVDLDTVSQKKMEYLIETMVNEMKDQNDFQEELLTTQLKTLLLYASKQKLKFISEIEVERLSSTITDFQNLLEANYAKRHDVQFYADSLNISPKGLSKATKKELGRTTLELIRDKIIIEAKRDLYNNSKSVKEVSYNLGFDDPAYFSRFFKKVTTYAPRDYQKLATSVG